MNEFYFDLSHCFYPSKFDPPEEELKLYRSIIEHYLQLQGINREIRTITEELSSTNMKAQKTLRETREIREIMGIMETPYH